MLSLVETRLEADGTLSEIEIISYDPLKKRFGGTDLDEMIKNSERLRYAAVLNGINDIKKDMQKKVQCLRVTVSREDSEPP